MKILSTNASNTSSTFRGLWSFGRDYITDADYMSLTRHRDAYYHPFADEAKIITDAELATLKSSITYPGSSDFQVETLVTDAQVAKTLSFTEAEYKGYKKFYGKTLPDSFKKIEQELRLLRLDNYINNGFIYRIKCFLHSLKK